MIESMVGAAATSTTPNVVVPNQHHAITNATTPNADPPPAPARQLAGAESATVDLPVTNPAAPTITDGAHRPTIRDLIALDLPTEIKVSPTGNYIAIAVRTTNWRENRYETACYLYSRQGVLCNPFTHTGSVQQIEWLHDDRLALLRSTYNGKAQIWLYEGLVGEGWQVTDHDSGITWFAPFAEGFVFRANRREGAAEQERFEQFGNYRHFEQEESRSGLYYVDIEAMRHYERRRRLATPAEGDKLIRPVLELSRLFPQAYSIRSVVPSPSGRALYLNCWRRDDLIYYNQSTNFCIAFDPAKAIATHLAQQANEGNPPATLPATDDASHDDESVRNEDRQSSEAAGAEPTVHEAAAPGRNNRVTGDLGTLIRLPLPIGAEVVAVAPDGESLLIDHQGRDDKIYTRSDLWLLRQADLAQARNEVESVAKMQNLSAELDRDLFGVQWTEQGIFAAYVDGTHIKIARFDPQGAPVPLDLKGQYCAGAFDVGKCGILAWIGANEQSYPDAYCLALAEMASTPQPTKLTAFDKTMQGWDLGAVETIRWQSKDGIEIEGVLRKPANFDPQKRYPLVFVVHGGPRGYSDASLLTHPDRMYYPAIQFVNADMLVLYPNYRGSTGRGQAFTELNVNNLGIGDLWDLESAIDHLVALGWVDETLIGCMGWSQGGYISAFAGLHSERFRAVSVGAGISDWYTYHISNDIPYFTTDYLSGSPFHNRDQYSVTAPMSNIANAKTPMLIQHGAEDRRVPVSNAMELYRGLQAMNVPVELYIYPGMGHPITKPRENHAVMYQNWHWFAQYLLGQEAARE